MQFTNQGIGSTRKLLGAIRTAATGWFCALAPDVQRRQPGTCANVGRVHALKVDGQTVLVAERT
jgi:hypothetical protein